MRGRVQAIGYRWFVEREARLMGITGWVRNCDDGSVEIEAQSGIAELKSFEAAISSGHPLAHVREVEVADIPAVNRESEFLLRT